jgi:ferredoxin
MVSDATAARWKLAVQAETCVASGMCAAMAPKHFILDGPHSRPLLDETDPDDDVIDAAESCPVEAITVRDAATGELIAPTDL